EKEGETAKQRIANGFARPHRVRYWSIGNENWGPHEIGAKTAAEWGVFVREAAKMMRHVDPDIELSAAALADVDWNLDLLKNAGPFLDWISIHDYWDPLWQVNDPAGYEKVMGYTASLEDSLKRVEGLLAATGYLGKIRIAYDEWNLRGWHHPGVHTIRQSDDPGVYIDARDKNDENSTYTLADAVFAACFLNMCHRHCNTVGMAGFAPAVNTRGCIFTYPGGIVKRSTYYVFWLYTHYLGDRVIDAWVENPPELIAAGKDGAAIPVRALDIAATAFSDKAGVSIAAVNKDPRKPYYLKPDLSVCGRTVLHTLTGPSENAYNDIGRNEVGVKDTELGEYTPDMLIELPPHSVNVITVQQ
ncbi:MAG: alpha-N-arabinofuranosidase, partial [Parasporobacterium sp.]|nr:alpha-N-arabinofuranosidase [Parasporobacterium sp.]